MKKPLALLLAALLYPGLAGAASADYYRDYDDDFTPWWFGLGIGGASITSAGAAPSADRDAIAGSIDLGYRITPQWGLGIEYGVLAPTSGCGGLGCTPSLPEFAPNFTRWFLVGEYRPDGGGLRLRASAGVSSMCYRYYEGRRSGWEKFWDALLFGEDDDLAGDTSRRCNSLHAFGAALSVGYQWSLAGTDSSLGLQLRGEAANYDASVRAGTAAFRHRSVMMQLQLNFN